MKRLSLLKKKKAKAKNIQGGACIWSAESMVAEAGTRMDICPWLGDVVALVTLVRTVSAEW